MKKKNSQNAQTSPGDLDKLPEPVLNMLRVIARCMAKKWKQTQDQDPKRDEGERGGKRTASD